MKTDMRSKKKNTCVVTETEATSLITHKASIGKGTEISNLLPYPGKHHKNFRTHPHPRKILLKIAVGLEQTI